MFLCSWFLLVIVTASGFVMGVVDAAIGMGYGTVLTPVLFMIGFDPIQIVPAVLISQLMGGLLISFFNHKLKNADFAIGGDHLRAAIVLGALSAVGAAASVLVIVNLSKLYIALYIGIVATILGLVVLATRKKKFDFSWPKMAVMGLVAAFNKGLTGGGYGPIVTAGQIMSGVEEKSAVSITALSEVIVSLTAVFAYILTRASVDWVLTFCLIISVSFSAPTAAFIVKRLENGKLKVLIGIATFLLGFATILKAIHP
jgi:uncharacterized membrane protein YfcA